MGFSTFDSDHDMYINGSCAVTTGGAWWYRRCHRSNLNGRYMYLNDHHPKDSDGIMWVTWHGFHYSLKSSEMMIAKR